MRGNKAVNKRWSIEELLQERQAVISEHPSGKEIDLDEAIEYQRDLPPGKILVNVLAKARERGHICLIAGMGHTTLEDQIDLLTYIQNEGQADFLGTTVDSFTRAHDFEAAERGLQESLRTGKSLLNGLPVVAYGVQGMRSLAESLEVPLQSRYASYDPRLMHEILFAAGHTGDSGSAMFTFWNYNKTVPLETVLHNYQYIYRLQGYYQEKGCPMCHCPYGVSPVLVPPSSAIVAQLTQLLMLAEQGMKYSIAAFPIQGNLIQDVACAKTYFKLARSYLDRLGYTDVELFREVYYIFGRFPSDAARSLAVTAMNCLVAKLCGAQVAYIRTISEAGPVPTKEEYGASYRTANLAINLLGEQEFRLDSKALATEAEMFELETRFIMDKMLDLGEGDVVVGIGRAIETGVFDNPWSTHPSVALKIMGVRDAEGAVRYMDTGNLPFPNNIKEFHRGKVAERSKKLGQQVSYNTVIEDITSVERGILV